MTSTPEFSSDGFPMADRLCIRWTENGARFHIWFGRNATENPGAMKWLPRRERVKYRSEERRLYIYKNPPGGMKPGQGWFETRKMDGDRPKWAAVVAAATEYANSGEPERAAAYRLAREEAKAREEAAKDSDAHGAATKERLTKFAEELPHGDMRAAVRFLAGALTNQQADRLSAYVHDLVRS